LNKIAAKYKHQPKVYLVLHESVNAEKVRVEYFSKIFMLGKAKVVQNKVVRVMNTEELIELLKKWLFCLSFLLNIMTLLKKYSCALGSNMKKNYNKILNLQNDSLIFSDFPSILGIFWPTVYDFFMFIFNLNFDWLI
jgi:hypothetical protein